MHKILKTVFCFLFLVVSLGTINPTEAQEYGIENGELRAQLTPQKYVTLSAGLDGIIEKLAVREGLDFSKGDLLISFDCALQQAQLDKANAQLAQAVNIHNGNKEMAKHNAIGAVELEDSRIGIDKAKADLTYLEASISHCTILAPYAGSVGRQLAREKAFVQIGQPLLEIHDTALLELEFIVPSKWLVWLKPGYQFNAHIEDTNRVYPVKLKYTAARVDPMSQSIKAVAVIEGKFPELLPGMSGRLDLKPPETAPE